MSAKNVDSLSDSSYLFTSEANHALLNAKLAAQSRNRDYASTEHILLGLLVEPSARSFFSSLCLSDPEGIDAAIRRIDDLTTNYLSETKEGSSTKTPLENIMWTPRSKKIIQMALDESRRDVLLWTGTQHLILGIFREGEGIAAGVLEHDLKEYGLNYTKAKKMADKIREQQTREPKKLLLEGLVSILSNPYIDISTRRTFAWRINSLSARWLEENETANSGA
ncbi:hypothetical protein M1563_03885 [Patescibacteria group bacterium]|nr:hypothetical protein [Patescibacteria group bacterium]